MFLTGAASHSRSLATIQQYISHFDLLPHIADQLSPQIITTRIIE